MRRFYLTLIISLILISVAFPVFSSNNSLKQSEIKKLEVDFFYSKTCPHCEKEQGFLDDIEKKYPKIEINRYPISDSSYNGILIDLAKEHEAERYLGVVPLTFVGDDYFVGFDNENGVGEEIENSIERQLKGETKEDNSLVRVPFLGKINTGDYSLPILSVILGFLDGFNVCSLGALTLILGLVMVFKSRKKIIAFGGVFLITTAIIYGLLIILWYQLFVALSPYIAAMELFIGLLATGSGIYFLNESRQHRKYGPTCNTSGSKIVDKFSNKVKDSFHESARSIAILGIIFIFAAVITIVEFPCSAAVPVVYAGVLSSANLSTGTYLLYISIYIIFYLLDELIVFLIAAWKMDIWMTSPKFTVWATFVAGTILFMLGLYYLIGFL